MGSSVFAWDPLTTYAYPFKRGIRSKFPVPDNSGGQFLGCSEELAPTHFSVTRLVVWMLGLLCDRSIPNFFVAFTFSGGCQVRSKIIWHSNRSRGGERLSGPMIVIDVFSDIASPECPSKFSNTCSKGVSAVFSSDQVDPSSDTVPTTRSAAPLRTSRILEHILANVLLCSTIGYPSHRVYTCVALEFSFGILVTGSLVEF